MTSTMPVAPTSPVPADLDGCRRLPLQTIGGHRGELTIVEAGWDVPFPINRAYFLYRVPPGGTRGGHAHRALHQCLIPVSGSFDVLVHNGVSARTATLDDPTQGLHIPPMIWRELVNFSDGAVCLSLVSAHYDEADYIRDWDAFVTEVAGR